MKKRIRVNVIIMVFLLAVLAVLIVLPEKGEAIEVFYPGWTTRYGDIPVCECPMVPVYCACNVHYGN